MYNYSFIGKVIVTVMELVDIIHLSCIGSIRVGSSPASHNRYWDSSNVGN